MRISMSSFPARLLLAVLSVAVIYFYNRATLDFTPVTQLRFEHWLSSTGEQLIARGGVDSPIEVTVNAELPRFSGTWRIALPARSDNEEQSTRVHRLLELARDAELFHYESLPLSKERLVRVWIKGADKTFLAFIPGSRVSEHLPTQTFLQLIQVYAEQEFRAIAQIGERRMEKQEL